MSYGDTKQIIINVKELFSEKDQYVTDLMRFLTEQLPQIDITRNGNELESVVPESLSKRAIKLRLKKFLYQKNLNDEFRPISYRTSEIDGYMIKRKKILELSYY